MTDNDRQLKKDTEKEAEVPLVIGLDAHSEKLVFSFFRKGTDEASHECLRRRTVHIADLETFASRHIRPQDVTALEASTNSFSIAERMERIGLTAYVVNSEAVACYGKRYHVTDEGDADNLARYYMSGCAEIVWKPDPKSRHYRDIFFGYRNARKDKVRTSNRIWAFGSGHGLKSFSKSKFDGDVESAVVHLSGLALGEEDKWLLGLLLEDWRHAAEAHATFKKRMAEIAVASPDMLKLMQILGLSLVVSFALVAFIGDITRFKTHKKLVTYIGLNPSVVGSGKTVGKGHLVQNGRGDLRSLLVQGAQAAMRYGKDPVHRWAYRLSMRKPKNVSIVALARKMTTYAWHVLMGHPSPLKEAPKAFKTKMLKLATILGREHVRQTGFKNASAFVDALAEKVFGPPPAQPTGTELQTVSLASA